LPRIQDKTEFVHKIKDGYQVIDYQISPQFEDKIQRECRGIKFDASGYLIARPFHKFYNLNEAEETQQNNIDWTKKHRIFEKLDGSMVHFANLNQEFVPMTRMGYTWISEQVESYLSCKPQPRQLAKELDYQGITALFEWISPNNLSYLIKKNPLS